ncbi:MAG: hypothetical protein JO189_21035 [Deltaproteobacteria bacterium]|nr:hypothetical protein [Deltaproteobacteria bacterium]
MGGARATAYGVVELGDKRVRLTQVMDGSYHLVPHKGDYGVVNQLGLWWVRQGGFGRCQKHGGVEDRAASDIAGAKKGAKTCFLEFFTVNIRNRNTRTAYCRAAGLNM